MAIVTKELGPQSATEREEFAIQQYVFSVQLELQKAMHENCVSQKELAERLGKTPARVSQIFSEKGANLTLETVARVAFALGIELSASRRSSKGDKTVDKSENLTVNVRTVERANPWREIKANIDRKPEVMVA